MTHDSNSLVNGVATGVVYVIACAAGPATELATLVRLAQATGGDTTREAPVDSCTL
jgi:hypothetical protein